MPDRAPGATTKVYREAERQRGLELAGPYAHLLDGVAHDLHHNESLHLHDASGPVERCGYCYLRAGRALGAVAHAASTYWTNGGDLATVGRCLFRPVGWQGQTGAFYADEAAARAGEPGGYSPVYVQVSPE